MKQLFTLFCAFMLVFQAKSQIQEEDSVIVLQNPSGRLSGLIDIQDLVNEGFNYWEEEFEGHWAGVELGFNGQAFTDYSLYSETENNFLKNDLIRSNILNINLLQYSRGLQRNRSTIGMVTGLGLSLQSFRLDNKTTLTTDEYRKVYPETLFFDSNQKSKLSSVYLDIPVLIEFQFPVGHSANRIYLSGGITGSKRLETHTKVKYRRNKEREKLKAPGDYSIRDYKIAGTVRMGYRWFNLFASCDLVPMFEDRRGPQIYPFSFGIKLISF